MVNIVDKYQRVKKKKEEISGKIIEIVESEEKGENLKKLHYELEKENQPVRRKVKSIKCFMDKKAKKMK